MNLSFYPSLPEDYGTYVFKLTDGSILQGYYSSFPFPDDHDVVRVSNPQHQYFWYLSADEIEGYYQ